MQWEEALIAPPVGELLADYLFASGGNYRHRELEDPSHNASHDIGCLVEIGIYA